MEFTVNWIIFSAIAIVIGSSAETRKLFCSNSRIYFHFAFCFKNEKIFPFHFGYFGNAQMTFSWHWDWFLFIGGSRTIWCDMYVMHCNCIVFDSECVFTSIMYKCVYIHWQLLMMTTRQFCKCISSFFLVPKKKAHFHKENFNSNIPNRSKWITRCNIVHDPYVSVLYMCK